MPKLTHIALACSLLALPLLSLPHPLSLPMAQALQEIPVSVKRYALVIGNSNYQEMPLANPVNDAEDMTRTLRSLNFEVTEAKNIKNNRDFRDLLDQFMRKVQPGSVALVFYAGHGIQVKGQNYLVPTQALIRQERDVPYEALNVDDMIQELQNHKTRLNVIILDACRNNPYESKFRAGRGRGLAISGEPVPGTLIAYATAANSVASDGTARNGLYTQVLLGTLKEPGLSLQDVFMTVRQRVAESSGGQQIPAEYNNTTEYFRFSPVAPRAPEIIQPRASATPQLARPTPVPDRPPESPVCSNCPVQLTAGQSVELSYRLEDLDGDRVKVVVSWGDGQSSESEYVTGSGVVKLSYRYANSGSYTVQSSAWTSNGIKSRGSSSHHLRVQEPAGSAQELSNSLGMKFRLIPKGSFMMGSPATEEDRYSSEVQHRVTLSSDYYMQTTEVTQGQWQAVMGTNIREQAKKGTYTTDLYGESANHPMYYVSWDDVQAFIRKLNARGEGQYRLPTEAEWEYAARGRSETAYGFGSSASELGSYAWYDGNSGNSTHTVGQKRANAYGLHDMHGNVSEWVSDWYEDYPSSAIIDPSGASSGNYRVIRGGSWYGTDGDSRSASRFKGGRPDDRDGNLGFRLLRTK